MKPTVTSAALAALHAWPRAWLTLRQIVQCIVAEHGDDASVVTTIGTVGAAMANTEARGLVAVDRTKRPFRYRAVAEKHRVSV